MFLYERTAALRQSFLIRLLTADWAMRCFLNHVSSKTELPNQQFKYIEEAEKTAAVQKVLSQRQFGIRCLNIIYLFWCLRKLAIERLLSINLKTRQLHIYLDERSNQQIPSRCFRRSRYLGGVFYHLMYRC